MELGNGWYCLTTGDIPKNIDCTEFMRVRFTVDSDWRLTSVWIYGVRNTNSNILTWIVLKPNKTFIDWISAKMYFAKTLWLICFVLGSDKTDYAIINKCICINLIDIEEKIQTYMSLDLLGFCKQFSCQNGYQLWQEMFFIL